MRRAPRLPFLLLLVLPAAAAGQTWTHAADQDGCRERRSGERDRWCEVREATLVPGARIDVDGGLNGGVSVHGWDRDEVRVRARVFARDRRGEDAARRLAGAVRLVAEGGRLRAEGPEGDDGRTWGVAWEVWTPRGTDVDLRTRNGGVRLDGLRGVVRFEALNGGVRLEDMAGDVRGETMNGGLDVRLSGERWEGGGLEVETMNGGVDVRVPGSYSARLVTGTVNGALEIDFPVTVRGRVDRRITTVLGEGGPTVRVETRNGGVRIRRP